MVWGLGLGVGFGGWVWGLGNVKLCVGHSGEEETEVGRSVGRAPLSASLGVSDHGPPPLDSGLWAVGCGTSMVRLSWLSDALSTDRSASALQSKQPLVVPQVLEDVSKRKRGGRESLRRMSADASR